jgi:hypothetical protein
MTLGTCGWFYGGEELRVNFKRNVSILSRPSLIEIHSASRAGSEKCMVSGGGGGGWGDISQDCEQEGALFLCFRGCYLFCRQNRFLGKNATTPTA